MRITTNLRNHRILIAFAILLALVIGASKAMAQDIVGQTTLALPGGSWKVNIEDLSPDAGSKPEAVRPNYATQWGVSLAITRSGAQPAASPASGWFTPNGPVWVDHVATVDAEGRLMTFFWSPPTSDQSTDTDAAGWKAVDISEKSGQRVRIEQPASWKNQQGAALVERIAARDDQDRIQVFSWSPGKDWSAQVVPTGGATYSGPVSAWETVVGGTKAEALTARTKAGAITVMTHTGSSWSHTDITAGTGVTVAGDPTGWSNPNAAGNRIAAHDTAQHLWLFQDGISGWSATDLTLATNGQKAIGPVDAWSQDNRQHIAARAPNGDLLVFREDTIESRWSVTNVSDQTKVQIAAPPTHWRVSHSAIRHDRIAAPDQTGAIHIFDEIAPGSWTSNDVTKITGVRTNARLGAWVTPAPAENIEHLAAPTPANLLHVFSFRQGGDWTAVDVTTRSAGRVVYAASPWAGVFASRDYGARWAQSTRPQPRPSASSVPGALAVPTILDIAVSPTDPNLVFAATDREGRSSDKARVTSAAGVYRSGDGGQTWALVYQFNCNGQNQPVSQIEFAPDDPDLIYAAGHCGLAEGRLSTNTWTLLPVPDTDGAPIPGTARLHHVAVGKQQGADKTRVIAACGPDNMWISDKTGAAGSWINDTDIAARPDAFCRHTDFQYLNESAAEVLALDPETPLRVYYAHHSWANGPSYYHPSSAGPEGISCNIPVLYDADDSRTFGAGDLWIKRERQEPTAAARFEDLPLMRFVDTNADGDWDVGEQVFYDVNDNNSVDDGEPWMNGRGATRSAAGTALTNEPLFRYLVGGYGGLDPGYGTRGCGEGSLWMADFTTATAASPTADWTQLPGPPVYHVLFGTGSGSAMVRTVATSTGHLVFFTDADTLHVAEGPPTANGWYRLDGTSRAEAEYLGKRVNISVHADPRGLAISEKYEIELTRSDQRPPYNLMSELKECGGGRVWLSGDGGVYSNADCGRIDRATDTKLWQNTQTGLNILWSLNVAGATGSKMTANVPRGFYTGTTHDDDFSTVDGGKTWGSPPQACGDCEIWFGDLYQRSRVVRIDARGNKGQGEFLVFQNTKNAPPDASSTSILTKVNYPAGALAVLKGSHVIAGSRHAIQTLPGQTPPKAGDYVVIVQDSSGNRKLMRAHDSISATATNSGFVQVGPDLPAGARIVQAAGGHASPEFYVGNTASIWRLGKTAAGVDTWESIYPKPGDGDARRFFVDPWREDTVYLIDDADVRVSKDGGNTWATDTELTALVSDGGAWQFTCHDTFCLLNDMAFDPTNANRRFAAGVAGVFYTAGGTEWTRLLDTRSLPSRPLSLWFDPLTDPANDTLVVAAIGRGILSLSPIPDTDPVRPLQWLAPPGQGAGDLPGWITADFLSKPKWTLNDAVQLAEPKTREPGRKPREAMLVMRDATGRQEAVLSLDIPCDPIPKRISYDWRAVHNRVREVPDAVDVTISEPGGPETLVATLGAEQSNGEWQTEVLELADGRCERIELRFSGRMRGERGTEFNLRNIGFAVLPEEGGQSVSMP